MTLTPDQQYDVFVQRDTRYDMAFFMGVKSTGIFCRPGCPARTPKRENVEFYETANAAVKAGYRPCKRCHPMNFPGQTSPLIRQLINLVESDPDRKWSEKDLIRHNIDPSTARRQFKSRFGMTFSQYVRNRNLARAAQQLEQGDKVIDAQLTAGFESPSGFRTAYAKTFGQAPANAKAEPLLVEWLDSPLGPIIVICDDAALYLLEFTNRKNIKRQFDRLSKTHKRAILPGRTRITEQIASELDAYFAGELRDFKTPLAPTGTEFQKSVWDALRRIPYGETRSYAELAKMIGNEKAVRAVAGSNASNGLALIVPCHRVINKCGNLGGYAGGLDKKEWLLALERGEHTE